MALLSSVLGSLSPSPKFRSSFEDLHASEHHLPLRSSPPTSPRIPPPVASTASWNTPTFTPPPKVRVPDNLLAIQRRARHLEQQLQELLDAQADGLLSGLAGGHTSDDIISNGSTTPTVSSIRDPDRDAENGDVLVRNRKKKISLNAARRGIFQRIQQLSNVKAEELDILDEGLQELQSIVEKTKSWGRKRSRLESRIKEIGGENAGVRNKNLEDEALRLDQEIRVKEEELWTLKRRHRRLLTELASSENFIEANLSSYRTSLSMLEKEITAFLAKPARPNSSSNSSSPFWSLPPKRRTLEMAREYWQDECTRIIDKCQEIDADRYALDEGAQLWNDVVRKVLDFEVMLHKTIQHATRQETTKPSDILQSIEAMTAYLQEKLDFAASRSWNLLVCAIGAEFEAFNQGKEILENSLGLGQKSKENDHVVLVDTAEHTLTESANEGSLSATRIPASPSNLVPNPRHQFFDTDDEDPDPELLISHQDPDTD